MRSKNAEVQDETDDLSADDAPSKRHVFTFCGVFFERDKTIFTFYISNGFYKSTPNIEFQEFRVPFGTTAEGNVRYQKNPKNEMMYDDIVQQQDYYNYYDCTLNILIACAI